MGHSDTTGAYGRYTFIFLGSCKLFSKGGVAFYTSTSRVWNSQLLYPLLSNTWFVHISSLDILKFLILDIVTLISLHFPTDEIC